VTGLVEAFAERGHIASGGIGRKASNKPDHRASLPAAPAR
jgi:hypothetical protein